MHRVNTSTAVEVIGRSFLIAQLTEGGIEVARPEREIGVDLLAYVSDPNGPTLAVPLQLKAASARSFSIQRKYEGSPSLLMVHVWNVRSDEETEVYALTYREGLAIGDELGWTATRSWTVGAMYRTGSPKPALREALAPFRMSAEGWSQRIRQAWFQAVSAPSEGDTLVRRFGRASDALHDELEWQAMPDGNKYSSEPPPAPLDNLLAMSGSHATLVVRSHTEGLGPKALFGAIGGLTDVMARRSGRLRPFPALQVSAGGRRVVIPLDLIEGIYPGDARKELGLAEPYAFEGLSFDDTTTGDEYQAAFPHV